MSQSKEPLDPFEFFETPWFKDAKDQLCADGWPMFVVPLNIEICKAKEAYEALQAKVKELEAENEFLQTNGIHTCSNKCGRQSCVQGREITKLKQIVDMQQGALKRIKHNNYRGINQWAQLHFIASTALAETDKLLNDLDKG